MGDDKRRPDAPTEPPDIPEGTKGPGSQEWARLRASEVPRGSTEGTGDDGVETCRPAKPGSQDDEVEGTRVEAVETAMSEALRGIEECPGEVSDDENQPRTPKEPSGKPQVKMPDPDDIQVEPGGETGVERDGSAVHNDVDAADNGRAEEALQEAQVNRESVEMHQDALIEVERWCARV